MNKAELYFSIMVFLFMIGSLIGWGLEVVFRRIFSAKKWINPGFLAGPYLPIYGVGTVVLYFICSIDYASLFGIQSKVLCALITFVTIGLVLTLIELIAGLIFVRGMKIRLWDYTDRWGNFKGIICPLFSLLWTLAGAAYYFLVHPFLIDAVTWFMDNYFTIFFVGIFYGIMLWDLCKSLGVMGRIKASAQKYRTVINVEKLKLHLKAKLADAKLKPHFFVPFVGKKQIDDELDEFAESDVHGNSKNTDESTANEALLSAAHSENTDGKTTASDDDTTGNADNNSNDATTAE